MVSLLDVIFNCELSSLCSISSVWFFLFKDRLIQQWNEIRKTKRKFLFGVLTGWLFLILMTVFFGFISGILRQFLGLDGQGLNQSNIQSTFQEQPLLIAVFACVIGPFMEELFFRQLLLHHLQKSLSSWLSILLVGLVFALTHMHSLALSEWVSAVGYLGGGIALSIIYVKGKENIYYPLVVHMLGNSLSFIILVISSM
ncbi:CAAX amino terminal protease family protein [Streptococcus oralis]|uniref:CAAX amino terminal protease family protein n=1 Tax=Streptococcus oralis TaxID=1303 RepID=A0A139NW67_STROR|nr:CAAX amino terminal protease family protein [Streptococcus oralis]